jgi:hypothetical protein
MRRTPIHGSIGPSVSGAGKQSDAVARTAVREGEIGCVFDEIQNLVESTGARWVKRPNKAKRQTPRSAARCSRTKFIQISRSVPSFRPWNTELQEAICEYTASTRIISAQHE